MSSVVDDVNRSLLAFLWFLLALALAAGIGAWWLGPGVVGLVLDEERRSQPYFLLHFSARGNEPDEYAADFASLVQAEQGQLLWRGSLVRLLDGRLQDEWPDLMLFRMPTGGSLAQTVTSPEYRELTAERRLLLLGAPQPPEGLTDATTLLVWLTRADADDPAAVDAAQQGVIANLGEYGGALVWQAPLDMIGGRDEWDHLAVMAFPDVDSAERWFREPGSLTERTLAGRSVERQAWLLLRAAYLASQ